MEEILKAKMEEQMKAMASVNAAELSQDHRPFLVVHKDGRVQRFLGTATVSAGADPLTGVVSRDAVVSPETGVYVRVYAPPGLGEERERVPLLVYFHGGGFCVETAASPAYHHHLNALAARGNIVIASVDYRLAPEHPLPAAYDDCWLAINWIAGCEEREIKDHADLSRVFFAGDSAGANISHHMAKRIGKNPIAGMKLRGVILVHPYFWGKERIGSEAEKVKDLDLVHRLWDFVCPGGGGSDDPRINPARDEELGGMAGERVLVLVAQRDVLRDRGVLYKELLGKSGWRGEVELLETVEEDHVFLLFKPNSDNAVGLINKVADFINA